ncbi:MAG: DUF6577 family protein [Rectinema sp.]|jgi:hypothetical protein|nr:hypothetical protein [Spirochaetaceae bacterium]
MSSLESNILSFAQAKKDFTVGEIRTFIASVAPSTPDSTILWRLHDMVARGSLRRIGRGRYTVPGKEVFSFVPSDVLRGKTLALAQAFPYAALCVWDIDILNSFSRHQFSVSFDIVEIEKVAVAPAQEFLEDYAPPCVVESALKHVPYDDLSRKRLTVVKPLVGESPLERDAGIPTPSVEKIIVDLYCDGPVFSFLQGNETMTIIEALMNRYAINSSKLIRYASRRGKEEEFQKIVSKFMANIAE